MLSNTVMPRFLFVLAPVLSLTFSLFAQPPASSPPPRLLLKDFFDNPKYASAEISPDGKRLAFLAPADNNRLNVWICDAGAPLDARRSLDSLQSRLERG